SDARVPVYCNIDAMPTTAADELKNKLLQQITGSVRYEDAVQNMVEHGVSEFVEIGPGKVLAGLNKKIVAAITTQFASDPITLEALCRQTISVEI
ncbi:MAG: malonyl CoA-acyl carrier protein transacylase, partial [Candidatus Riflebacteria bacterium]|nr:malonyl CoA-acyl carrier protein transacylase [Candidatus Riflebacteria bacterium]